MAGSAEDWGYVALAARHGLDLRRVVRIDDLGLDYRVVEAVDAAGRFWILRIPRHKTASGKVETERARLAFLRARLPAAAPDWRIVSAELIAYPLLEGNTAISVDKATGEVTWNVDKDSPVFVDSFAAALAALHGISVPEAVSAGFTALSPEQVRARLAGHIERVKRELGMGGDLETRWRAWLDDDSTWPDFSTVVHGDLYPGHVLVDGTGCVTGIIDWSEAEVANPAVDMAAQEMLLGESAFVRLLRAYENAGGRTWPSILLHIKSWQALAPLQYAVYALDVGEGEMIRNARDQLGG